MSHTIPKSTLREYDIRGVVDDTLSEKDAYAVGRSFGTIVKRRGGTKAGVVFDGRDSSPRLSDALILGLNECGLDVECYGVGPTPLCYYALENRDLDAVVAITGSHNPPEYNGIKMALKGQPVYGDQIQELGRLAESDDWESGDGRREDLTIYEEYTDRLARDYQSYGKPDLKIAWDAGNGAVGAVLKMLTDKLPGEHILLFDDVDGSFPNHHPDPAEEKNLEDLRQCVAENGCDFGVAFDGDGDRIGVIDRHGHIVWGDQLIALYAKDILTRVPNAKTLFDVKCSQACLDLASQYGADVDMWKTGHSLMKARMKEINGTIGGELSGHIYIAEGFYHHDDGLYCAVRLMNVVQHFGDLHDLHQDFPKTYATPEIRFDVPEERKFAIIEDVKEALNTEQSDDIRILDIDGVRVSTPQGWFLIRASNTQNALSLRAEAQSEADLAILKQTIERLLTAAQTSIPEALAA